MQSARQLLLVAGSGRSGTSLFAGLTGRLGLHLPKPEVSTDSSNPRGFSEPRWAVDFHDELLGRADVDVEDGRPEAWDLTEKAGGEDEATARLAAWLEEQFGQADRVVVKDPRLGWFLPSYLRAADRVDARLHVATLLRDPAEILRSREKAYGTITGHSTRAIGWVNMMLGVESRTRPLPRAVVRYQDLLSDWRSALEEAEGTLGLELVAAATESQRAAADDLVDPSLRRSATDWDGLGLHPRVRDLTARTYAALDRLVGTTAVEQTPVRTELDALREEYAALYDEAYDIALSRTRAHTRRERRKAIARVRAELTGAGRAVPDTRTVDLAREIGRRVRLRVGERVRR